MRPTAWAALAAALPLAACMGSAEKDAETAEAVEYDYEHVEDPRMTPAAGTLEQARAPAEADEAMVPDGHCPSEIDGVAVEVASLPDDDLAIDFDTAEPEDRPALQARAVVLADTWQASTIGATVLVEPTGAGARILFRPLAGTSAERMFVELSRTANAMAEGWGCPVHPLM